MCLWTDTDDHEACAPCQAQVGNSRHADFGIWQSISDKSSRSIILNCLFIKIIKDGLRVSLGRMVIDLENQGKLCSKV